MPRLKNVALDCLMNLHSSTGSYLHLNIMAKGYANTSKESLLRYYLSNAAALVISGFSGDELIDLLSSTIGLQEQDLGVDIIRAMKRECELDEVTDPRNGDGGRYHKENLRLGSKHSKQDLTKGHL